MVHDNYNALVVGFSPTELASDAPFSIALYPRWVTPFFLEGALLFDPDWFLKGSANRVRYVVLSAPLTSTGRRPSASAGTAAATRGRSA